MLTILNKSQYTPSEDLNGRTSPSQQTINNYVIAYIHVGAMSCCSVEPVVRVEIEAPQSRKFQRLMEAQFALEWQQKNVMGLDSISLHKIKELQNQHTARSRLVSVGV